jgi:hypothetical protein
MISTRVNQNNTEPTQHDGRASIHAAHLHLMPKRKRAASEGCCQHLLSDSDLHAPLAPLTTTNLELLQQALAGSRVAMRTPSPSRNTDTLDDRKKLAQYGIHVDTGRALPEALQQFVAGTIKQSRNPAAVPSPNAKRIVDRRRFAAQQNESTSSQLIVPYILFAGEADMDDRTEAIPFITRKAELLLNRFFLPPAIGPAVKDTWKELSQPKPDSCIGYVSRSDAAAAGYDAPFSAAEESILNDYVLTKSMYMPFLTAQWKTPTGNEGLYEAASQAARDGAVVVNHLYDLYTVAYGTPPSIVDACHFSVIGDLQYLELWIHWRDGKSHHMEMIDHFAYRKEGELQQARGLLHNIKNHALDTRLRSIQDALPAFASAKKKPSSKYPAVPMSQSSASASVLSHPSASVFQAPLTPSSVASEPYKKRARLENDGGFD